MAEPDENDLPSTRTWSGPNDADAHPVPRLSDSAVEGFLGAPRPRRSAGWEPPAPEVLQASLPQYEIRALLGRGGMGAVYQGWQRSLDRFVAIKILPPSLESAHHEFGARFKREAKAMARLKHPGIIPVHDAGETPDGLLYFVMDYVAGIDAQKLLSAEGRLATEKALTIVCRVLDALAYAHEHGIIHRDIKPANVMIGEEGRVQIADFGLARSLSAESSLLTGSQVAMGTPDYMAPESRLGVATVDHRADLYAVGVMLYRMLTGKLPHGRYQAPSLVVPALDKRLDRIVDRALAPDREARYSSAIELRNDLEPILTRAQRRSAPLASGSGSGRKGLWGGVAVVAILAGAAFYFVAAKPPRISPTSPPVAKPTSAVSRETQAIRLWDEPQKLPNMPGIRWQDNAVRLDHGFLVLEGEDSRDVIFRARVRMNKEALSPKLTVRGRGTEEQQQNYSVGIDAREKKILLKKMLHGETSILQTWPFPRDYSPDEWAQLELRAIGGELTASLDGVQLGTVHDDSVSQSGHVMLSSNDAGFFRDIVYIPLGAAANGGSTAALEPGGLRLWDKPEKIPKVKGVSWENNALHLESAAASDPTILSAVFFRARVQMNPEAISPELNVRCGGNLQDRTHRGYSLAVMPQASKFFLAVFIGDQRRILASWPFPRAYGPDEWVQLGLRAVGDELIASIDGQALGVVHDSSIPREGHVMLFANAAGHFRDVVFIPLDPAANGSSAATLEPGAVRLWDTPEKIPALKGVSWEHDALHLESASATDPAAASDVFFRTQVQMNPEAISPQLSVRVGGDKQNGSNHGYTLGVLPKASRFELAVFTGGQRRVLAAWPFPRAYGPDEWVQLGLRAVGDELTASVDGQTLGKVHDSSIPGAGHVMLYANTAGHFRDAVVIPLDAAANGSSAATLDPGAVRLWDKPEKIPALKGVSWEHNALHLESAAATFPAAPGDVFFRVRMRTNPEAISPTLSVRVGGNQLDGSNCGYTLGIVHQASRFELAVFTGGQRRVLGSWPFPRTYGPDEWVRLGLRAVGDELTAFLDGQALGIAHDSSIPREGQIMLHAKAAGYFRDAVFIPLDQETNKNSAVTLEPGSLRLWDKAEKIPVVKGVSLEGDVLHLEDASATFVNPADRGDVFFRAQVRMNPDAVSAQIDVRVGGNKQDGSNRNYLLGVLPQASRFDLAVISGGQRRVLGSWPFPRTYRPDEWVQLGLRAMGDELTAFLDGRILGVVHDSSIPREGHVMLHAGAAGYFRDAIYTSLATPGASFSTPAAKPVSVEKAR